MSQHQAIVLALVVASCSGLACTTERVYPPPPSPRYRVPPPPPVAPPPSQTSALSVAPQAEPQRSEGPPNAVSDSQQTSQALGTAVADQADVSEFRDALTPYGDWAWNDSYGWIWCPHDVAPGWRPYTDGHWVYSDEFGWTWVSDEEWGWAPYHYGRWCDDSELGWFWVPGTVWGPAWVTWRNGDGFIGWAPLAPSVGFEAGLGFAVGGAALEVGIGAPAWAFVPETALLEPRLREKIVVAPRNVTLLRTTKNVTNVTVVNGRVVNRSVAVEHIEKLTGHPVPRTRIEEASSLAALKERRAGDGAVTMFRPEVAKAPPARSNGRGAPLSEGGAGPSNLAGKAQSEAELRQRQELERQRLAAHDSQVRATLEDQHRRELASPPNGTTAEQLRARQQQEVQAHEQQMARERQQLATRHQRQMKQPARPQRRRGPADPGGDGR